MSWSPLITSIVVGFLCWCECLCIHAIISMMICFCPVSFVCLRSSERKRELISYVIILKPKPNIKKNITVTSWRFQNKDQQPQDSHCFQGSMFIILMEISFITNCMHMEFTCITNFTQPIFQGIHKFRQIGIVSNVTMHEVPKGYISVPPCIENSPLFQRVPSNKSLII